MLIWRPQSIEQKKRKAMLEALKRGDRVVTVGGIHGTIVVTKKDSVVLQIAEKVEIEVDRSGIGSVRS
ncbi:MAG: preprotein translocase subunit YajC [Bacillota bacterium]|nr:MAG: preprotein translocase subunit YajC [Bacillota bacterium]